MKSPPSRNSRTSFRGAAAISRIRCRNGYFGVCMRHVTGTLIGYCVLMPVVDEMHLLNLCVAPQAQHAGAGLALLREAVRIARAEKLDGVLLEVRPSNPRAIQLYERFGFSVDRTPQELLPRAASVARGRNRHASVVFEGGRAWCCVNRCWKNSGSDPSGCGGRRAERLLPMRLLRHKRCRSWSARGIRSRPAPQRARRSRRLRASLLVRLTMSRANRCELRSNAKPTTKFMGTVCRAAHRTSRMECGDRNRLRTLWLGAIGRLPALQPAPRRRLN